jgi:hypothetical protein
MKRVVMGKRGSAIGGLLLVFLIIVIVALAIVNSPTGNVARSESARFKTATFSITSNVENAVVVVEDEFVGYTPVEVKVVPKDTKYNIRVTADGYRTFEKDVYAASGKVIEVYAKFDARLRR